MKHRSVQRKFSAYLDDELSPEERRIVDSHLEACESCREALERMRASWDLLVTMPGAKPSPHAFVRIKARMASQEDKPVSRWERFLVPATAAAALVLGIWVGSIVGKIGNGFASYGVSSSESAVYLETFDELPSGSLARVYVDLAAAE